MKSKFFQISGLLVLVFAGGIGGWVASQLSSDNPRLTTDLGSTAQQKFTQAVENQTTIQGEIGIPRYFGGINLRKYAVQESQQPCSPPTTPTGEMPTRIPRDYSDIEPGKRVLLLDAKGEVVSMAELSMGKIDRLVSEELPEAANPDADWVSVSCVLISV